MLFLLRMKGMKPERNPRVHCLGFPSAPAGTLTSGSGKFGGSLFYKGFG